MISYLKGDLLSSPAQVQVNTVNTVGAMGKGIALQFKSKYPKMFKDYQHICENHLLGIGNLYLWRSPEKWVLMFPTKQHWKQPSKLEYIDAGLNKFVQTYEEMGIESIAFPKLGCGNGGLRWDDVRLLMEKHLKDLPISIYIYVGDYKASLPEHEDADFVDWLHNKPRDMSFNMLKDDLKKALEKNNDILCPNGTIKHVVWNDNKITIQNGNEIVITEMELCDFWDYIKNVGIIEVKRIPDTYSKYADVMLEILKKLEYLKPILVASDENKLNGSLGYQFIKY